MFADDERQTGKRFDWVIVARPDVTWFAPLQPWCFWLRPGQHENGFKRWDWAFVAPRAKAEALLKEPYDRYWSCGWPAFKRPELIENYWHDHLSFDLPEEPLHLPVMITRLDGDRYPNNLCDFWDGAAMSTAAWGKHRDICPQVTYKNPCNTANLSTPVRFDTAAGWTDWPFTTCTGNDLLRGYAGSVAQCRAKCEALGPTCAGFLRIRSDGECSFRTGNVTHASFTEHGLRDCFLRNT